MNVFQTYIPATFMPSERFPELPDSLFFSSHVMCVTILMQRCRRDAFLCLRVHVLHIGHIAPS